MKIRPGSNTAVLIEGVEVIKPIPSLLQVLLRNTRWRDIFDGADGDMKGLMTENVIDDFHTQAVAAIDRLNHAGYTPDQISMETGLMPVKIDVVFEALGIEKQVASPGDVMLDFGQSKITKIEEPEHPPSETWVRFKNATTLEEKRAIIREILGGRDPSEVRWIRHRFYSHHADPRPVTAPPPGPWWCSGSTDDENGEIQIIVAYLPEGEEIKKYWPEVGEISFSEPYGKIEYSSRFVKPEWWPF